MKNKIVLWGTNDENERVLIGLELLPEENKVKVYTFPEALATEAFYQQLMDEWRDDKPVELPESGYSVEERPLNISDDLLPESLKVERGDVVQRAQTEWHFIVLSTKLSEAYRSELDELREKVDQLSAFDSGMWDSLKEFWNKVQDQVRDRNLLREHTDLLRDQTNELFSRLKDLKSKMDAQFENLSEQNFDTFFAAIDAVENKIRQGTGRFQHIFDELKGLQRKFREAEFTREHRSKIWEKLDGAFKAVKEKRFGSDASTTEGEGDDNSPLDRLKRRYDGLLSAIDKMEKSIQRDRDELSFQAKKVATTDGQLEAEIRKAKIKMVEERINSKEDKLGEMLKTREDLTRRLAGLEDRESKRKEREKIEQAKRAAQDKIALEIRQQVEARKEDEDKLEKAAEAITEQKEPLAETKPQDNLVSAAGAVLGELLEDAIDTAKAIAGVVGDQLENSVEDIKEALKSNNTAAAPESEDSAVATDEEE